MTVAQTGKPRVMMVRPDNYGLRYKINYWMRLENQPDVPEAQRQWERLHQINEKYADVVVASFRDKNTPDECYSANHGTGWGNDVILVNFGCDERKPEETNAEIFFAERGYCVHKLTFPFEGQGDALELGDTLFIGYGRDRTDIKSHGYVAEIASGHGLKTISAELADDRFYHIDTCFAPLGPDLLFYPDAFEPAMANRMRDNAARVVEVTEDEAVAFACNAVPYPQSRVIVMNEKGCTDRLRGKLESIDYACETVDMTEFIKTGGATKCLTLFLQR